MSPYECPKCKNAAFDASIDIAYKITGTLVRTEDELTLIPQKMDPMNFQCYQLKCAQCGENVKLKLIDLKYEASDIFAEDEIICIGY